MNKIIFLLCFLISTVSLAQSRSSGNGGGTTLPDQSGQAGNCLTTNGSALAWSSCSGGSSFALQDLSNLTTTAVNKSINFSDPDSAAVFESQVGATLQFLTANSGSGAGTGPIVIGTGSTSGSRAQISLHDGSEGTSGNVWTSTDATGKGHWAAPATAGTITALTADVTASGSGSVAATIAVGAVTDTKASLATKPPVTVVATSNLTLSGAQTIDGQLTVAGTSIVLATAQSTGSQNGPWVVQSGAWTRPTWYPSGGTTQSFQFITTLARLGSTYQGTVWRQTAAAPITIDTTATTWAVTPVALSTTTTTGLNAFATGDAVAVNSAASPYTIPANARLIQVDLSGGAVQLNLPDPTLAQRIIKVTTSGGVYSSSKLLTMHRFASEKIGYVASDLTLYADQGNYEFTSNLTDWLKTSASNNAAMIAFASTTFVAPATVTSMYCEGRSAFGGGGGGASGGGGSTATPGGGGGSGSAASLTLIVGKLIQPIPGTSYVITIGAHGTGGAGGIHKAANAAGATETASATPATTGTSTTFGALVQFIGGNGGGSGGANATFSSGGAAGGTATGFNYSNSAAAAGGNNAVAGSAAVNGASSIFALRGAGGAGGTSAASTGGGGGGGGAPGGADGNCAAGVANGGNGGGAGVNGSNGDTAPAQTLCPGGGGAGGGGGGVLAVTGSTGGDGGAGADGLDGVLRCRFNE